MNDKAIETPCETFPHALAGYLTRNGQVGNLPDCQRQIEDFMRDAKPESDTRGEVPDRQRSKLDPLVLLIARIKSIHGNVSDALSQQRILHELGRLLKLAYSIEASVLSELSALREENERLRKKYDEMIDKRWRAVDLRNEEMDRRVAAEAELATLRASASSDGWIEINEGCEMPEDRQVVRVFGSGYQEVVVFRKRVSGGINRWQTHHGSAVYDPQYWKHLDWPTATNPEKATSDRSQG